jgi:hypothetical protein
VLGLGIPGSRGEPIHGVQGCLGVPPALAWLVMLGCAAGFGIFVVVGADGVCATGWGWRRAGYTVIIGVAGGCLFGLAPYIYVRNVKVSLICRVVEVSTALQKPAVLLDYPLEVR